MCLMCRVMCLRYACCTWCCACGVLDMLLMRMVVCVRCAFSAMLCSWRCAQCVHGVIRIHRRLFLLQVWLKFAASWAQVVLYRSRHVCHAGVGVLVPRLAVEAFPARRQRSNQCGSQPRSCDPWPSCAVCTSLYQQPGQEQEHNIHRRLGEDDAA